MTRMSNSNRLRKGHKNLYRNEDRYRTNYEEDDPSYYDDRDRREAERQASAPKQFQQKQHEPQTLSAYFQNPKRSGQKSEQSDRNMNNNSNHGLNKALSRGKVQELTTNKPKEVSSRGQGRGQLVSGVEKQATINPTRSQRRPAASRVQIAPAAGRDQEKSGTQTGGQNQSKPRGTLNSNTASQDRLKSRIETQSASLGQIHPTIASHEKSTCPTLGSKDVQKDSESKTDVPKPCKDIKEPVLIASSSHLRSRSGRGPRTRGRTRESEINSTAGSLSSTKDRGGPPNGQSSLEPVKTIHEKSDKSQESSYGTTRTDQNQNNINEVHREGRRGGNRGRGGQWKEPRSIPSRAVRNIQKVESLKIKNQFSSQSNPGEVRVQPKGPESSSYSTSKHFDRSQSHRKNQEKSVKETQVVKGSSESGSQIEAPHKNETQGSNSNRKEAANEVEGPRRNFRTRNCVQSEKSRSLKPPQRDPKQLQMSQNTLEQVKSQIPESTITIVEQPPKDQGQPGRGCRGGRGRIRNRNRNQPKVKELNVIKSDIPPQLLNKPVTIIRRPVPKNETIKQKDCPKPKIKKFEAKLKTNEKKLQRDDSTSKPYNKTVGSIRKSRPSSSASSICSDVPKDPEKSNVPIIKENSHKSSTKVIFRLLPPNITKEEFLTTVERLGPLPPYDYFFLYSSDTFVDRAGNGAVSSVWINFLSESDASTIVARLKDVLFYETKTNTPYMAQATFDLRQLPFRHLRKKNVKRGTLERSKHYKDFVKDYQANPERYENVISLDQMAEEIKEKEAQAEVVNAPLVEYLLSSNQYDPYED